MKRLFRSLSAALAVLFILVSVMPASAATSGSSSLSITPTKRYTIKPGESVTDKLTISNIDRQNDLNISLRMIDFTYTDQSGTPKLAIGADVPTTTWSLKPFTTLPKDNITIPAGQTKTLNYTIKMPANIGAGSYYSAIMYQAGGANGGNVALNATGVTLAFVSVPGTVKENMTLQKFGAYTSNDNGTTGGFTYIAIDNAPKMIAYTLKNQGNVFENPAGNVIMKDMFGHQVANVTTNSTQSLALLGQTRLFTSCIRNVQQDVNALGGTTKSTKCVDPKLKPGRYTMNLDIFYGQNGNQTHEITAAASFWYLPIWFLVLVAVIIALLIWLFFWLRRKIRTVVKGTSYKEGKGISRHR